MKNSLQDALNSIQNLSKIYENSFSGLNDKFGPLIHQLKEVEKIGKYISEDLRKNIYDIQINIEYQFDLGKINTSVGLSSPNYNTCTYLNQRDSGFEFCLN